MNIKPNKEGADWLTIKSELKRRIETFQDEMLNPLTTEEYNRCRGAILMARDIIEWVEPTTPVQEKVDEGYGYLGGEDGNYA